ncbi:AAA family ATPase, partial [Pseudoxanthobacter sp. M-2]|uniref:AAA family ATPase n=1 Tax=Pseudoxanthobacter sp. M-2 TaxID=3078754 RepID=UPI0038FC0ACA
MPYSKGWTTVARLDPPPCAAPGAPVLQNALSTGILCDGLRAIDIDIDDSAVAGQVAGLAFNLLGDAIIRFRADSPRLLLVYAAADGEPSKRSISGERGMVEVLGRGQQFVADGTHPDGQPYQWRVGSPADTQRDNLVAVSEEAITEFFDEAAHFIKSPGEKAGHEAEDEASQGVASVEYDHHADHPLVKAWASGALLKEVKALAACLAPGRNNRLNNAALALGEFVAGGFLAEGDVRAALEGACRTNGLWTDDGPLQCRATINSGLKAGMQKPRAIPASILAKIEAEAFELPAHDPETGEVFEAAGTADPLPMVSAASFAGMPVPPRRWLVDGLIPAGTVTMLNGDGGTGKSLIALQLAVSAVLGVPWIGIDVEDFGPAIFLTAEDEIDEVHRRLVDVARAVPIDLDRLEALSICSLAGLDALLATAEWKSNILRATRLYAALKVRVSEIKPTLVVLDTLADVFGGEENDRAQARQFVSLLRGLAIECGTTIVLLAHPSLSGMASGSGTSGSTAWNNSVRSRLYFKRPMIEGRPDPDTRILETMKANYGRIGDVITLRWEAGVFVRASGAADDVGGEPPAKRAERIFLDMLRAYEKEGRRVSELSGANFAPHVFWNDDRR